jgi:hypothetical protein
MFKWIFPVLSFLVLVGRVFGIQFIQPYLDGDKVVFSFTGAGSLSEKCFLVGSFNRWVSGKYQFKKKSPNLYAVSLELGPGVYEYQYSIGGRWVRDDSNPLTKGDGFGGINSVLYINNDGTIDWAHNDCYNSALEFEKIMSQTIPTFYPVQLVGNYYISLMRLNFTNLEVILSNGIARLLETKAGVTGITYWGQTTVISLEENEYRTNHGEGVFMRFNPGYFGTISSNLEEKKVQPNSQEDLSYINCNNTFYLKKARFYHANDLFIIPPDGFIGISLNDAKYKKEEIYIIQNYQYKDDLLKEMHLQPVVKFLEAKQKDAKKKYGNLASVILKAWIKAVSTSDQSYVKQYLPLEEVKTGYVLISLFKDKHFQGIELIESTVRVTEPVALSAEIYDVMDTTSVFIVTCQFIEKNKNKGKIRLLVGRINNEWKILNFEIEG